MKNFKFQNKTMMKDEDQNKGVCRKYRRWGSII